MGEPLNNYEAVRSATSMMIDPALFSLRRSKVTISTVGIVPRILQVFRLRPFHPESLHHCFSRAVRHHKIYSFVRIF